MVADAFATRQEYVAQMIINMMDPSNYVNNYLKDYFLVNMYRIVDCCGAYGYMDYMDFAITPPQECRMNLRGVGLSYGGSFFQDGCAEKFTVWQRAWAVGTALFTIIICVLQVWVGCWCFQLVKLLKKAEKGQLRVKHQPEEKRRPPVTSQPKTSSVPPSSDDAPDAPLPKAPQDDDDFSATPLLSPSQQQQQEEEEPGPQMTIIGRVVNGRNIRTKTQSANPGLSTSGGGGGYDVDLAAAAEPLEEVEVFPSVPKRTTSVRKHHRGANDDEDAPPVPIHRSHVQTVSPPPPPPPEMPSDAAPPSASAAAVRVFESPPPDSGFTTTPASTLKRRHLGVEEEEIVCNDEEETTIESSTLELKRNRHQLGGIGDQQQCRWPQRPGTGASAGSSTTTTTSKSSSIRKKTAKSSRLKQVSLNTDPTPPVVAAAGKISIEITGGPDASSSPLASRHQATLPPRQSWIGTSPFQNQKSKAAAAEQQPCERQPPHQKRPQRNHFYQELQDAKAAKDAKVNQEGRDLRLGSDSAVTSSDLDNSSLAPVDVDQAISEMEEVSSLGSKIASKSAAKAVSKPVTKPVLTTGNSTAVEDSDDETVDEEEWQDLELPVSNTISYGYENVLPVSKHASIERDLDELSTSESTSIYSKAKSPTKPNPPRPLNEDLEGQRPQRTKVFPKQNQRLPLLFFPKRRKSEDRTFQLSLRKQKFQRVSASTPSLNSGASGSGFFPVSKGKLSGGGGSGRSLFPGLSLPKPRNLPSNRLRRRRSLTPDHIHRPAAEVIQEIEEDEYIQKKEQQKRPTVIAHENDFESQSKQNPTTRPMETSI